MKPCRKLFEDLHVCDIIRLSSGDLNSGNTTGEPKNASSVASPVLRDVGSRNGSNRLSCGVKIFH
jgi:hypothetical protein